jgi:CubicO group peptidase (beta-lactamase class C family)
MLTRRLFAAAALATLSAPAFAQTPPPRDVPSDAELTALIRTRVEEGRAKGIVLGVLERDGARRIVAFGDPGPGARPLGPDSVFEIGSITKTFTATLLADMAQRGEVDPARPAQTYAPPGLTLPKYQGQEITLANLAEQNSGLPRLPGNMAMTNMANPYADYTIAQLNTYLSGYTLPRAPGGQFEYSNLGVGLLGHLLATKAGMSWDQLASQRILGPLGMRDTAVALNPRMRENLAQGFTAEGQPQGLWDLPTLAGAGALRSTMADMLTYLDANVGPPSNDLEQAMRSAQLPRAEAGPNLRIGFNWLTLARPQGAIVWHNGATGGYRAFIGFDPQRQVGVVVMVNSSSDIDDIGLHLLDGTIPLAPRPAAAPQRVAVAVPPESLPRFAGTYALEVQPDFTIEFTVENGALMIHPKNQGKGPMQAESPTRFFITVPDVVIDFQVGPDGAVNSLILEQSGARLPARRIG